MYARFQVLIHEVAKFGIVGSLAFVLTIILINVFHSGAGWARSCPRPSPTSWPRCSPSWATSSGRSGIARAATGAARPVLFFLFNGIGILITDGVVAAVHYGLGLTGNFAFNVANLIGIALATLFRLYSYRRWVFLWAERRPPPSSSSRRSPAPDAWRVTGTAYRQRAYRQRLTGSRGRRTGRGGR